MIGLEKKISHQDFLDIIDAISEAKSIKQLVDQCSNKVAYAYGSYHHIPAIGSYDYNNLNRFWSSGLNKHVLDYLNTKGRKSDPVMTYVFVNARPYWLSEIYESDEVSEGLIKKRLKMALDHAGDGIVAPLFGPFNKRGYMFVGFEKPRKFFDDIYHWQVQAILQAVHVRYCILLEAVRANVKLTKRESEVLELISFGKTNPEIGTILGISTNTVSGYVKRIFLKFDASDRVTVALRAQSSIFI